MPCWSKLYCYRFKTRMKRIASAVEGGIENECGACSCLCSLLAQKPPSCLFSPCSIQLTKPQVSSDSLPACSSWTRLEKSPQYADQPHLKLRTIIFKRALCHTQPFDRISLVNFHPIHPEGYFATFTSNLELSLSHSHFGWENRNNCQRTSSSFHYQTYDILAIAPMCSAFAPCGPCFLTKVPPCTHALTWLPSPSPELSLSNHSLFLLDHHVALFLLDDLFHHRNTP